MGSVRGVGILIVALILRPTLGRALEEEEIKQRLGDDWRSKIVWDKVTRAQQACRPNCADGKNPNWGAILSQAQDPYVVAYLAKLFTIDPSAYDNLIPKTTPEPVKDPQGQAPPGSSSQRKPAPGAPGQTSGGDPAGSAPTAPGGDGVSGGGQGPDVSGASGGPGKSRDAEADAQMAGNPEAAEKLSAVMGKAKGFEKLLGRSQEDDGGTAGPGRAAMGSLKGQAAGGATSPGAQAAGPPGKILASSVFGSDSPGRTRGTEYAAGRARAAQGALQPASASSYAPGGSAAGAGGGSGASGAYAAGTSGAGLPALSGLPPMKKEKSDKSSGLKKSDLSPEEEKELDDFVKALDDAAQTARLNTKAMDASMAAAAGRKPSGPQEAAILDAARRMMELTGRGLTDSEKNEVLASASGLGLDLDRRRGERLVKSFETAEPPSSQPLRRKLSLWERFLRWFWAQRARLMGVEAK